MFFNRKHRKKPENKTISLAGFGDLLGNKLITLLWLVMIQSMFLAMTNPGSVLKSRDISLLTEVRIVKAMVFPVVMYGCQSWAIKKAMCQRIDTFELWCWKRLLGVPWTAMRANQSILKEISPEYSLEGLMLKLKLQYFGHLM